jgi:hypothetical protein
LLRRDIAEAIAQLAVYPLGREALLTNPAVAEALQIVAEMGWEEEAQHHAQSALVAMGVIQREVKDEEDEQEEEREPHVMLSYK